MDSDWAIMGEKIFHLNKADTFIKRFFGLMGKKTYPKNKTLFLSPCNSIHTFFMRFPITVVFVNKENYVLKVVENMKPWRMAFCFKAHGVYEYMTKGNEDFVPKIGEKVLSSSQFF